MHAALQGINTRPNCAALAREWCHTWTMRLSVLDLAPSRRGATPHEWEKEVVPFDPDQIENVQSISLVGSGATVKRGIGAFAERMQPDELIATPHIYDHAARPRSYELLADKS